MNDSKDLDFQQKIDYSHLGDGDVNSNTSVLVTADTVTVVPSRGDHAVGSSKVKLTNVVDYTWEQRFYTGQILAVHVSGKYIAYGIQGKESGIIRVFNFATSDRALIKGIEGMAQDIAFAFILSPVLLACIDATGDVYVYTVEENQLNSLSCCLLVHIKETSTEPMNCINRIVWCPYVPDDEQMEDDDASKLIVTRGNKAHLWNVTLIHSLHGIVPVSPVSVNVGFLEIKVDKHQIVDLAFSPDGSTVALACSDGGVRFFQVDVPEGQSPLCIHDWRPHEGKPVSCLYFLDNHLEADSAFWKFAVTGVEGNSEIKLWTCESWSCLQTLNYTPIIDGSPTRLKVAVDITANYILLSDMQRKLLHILQLKKNDEETGVRIHVISEFLLPYPILSFGIVKAGMKNFSDNSNYNFNDENREYGSDDKKHLTNVIKLYLVQPRALQECNIVYNPEEVSTKYLNSSAEKIDTQTTALLNGLRLKDEGNHSKEHDLKLISSNFTAIAVDATISEKFLPVSVIEDNAIMQQKHLEDLRISNSERKRESTLYINTTLNGCEETEEDECNERNEIEEGSGNGVMNEGKSYYSTGSSPSREVQNILFSSTVNDESCHNIQSKNENDLPINVWPKIPIPEPDNLCPDVSSIMRTNSDQLRICNENNVESKKEEYLGHNVQMQAVYAKINSMEERLNQLTETCKSQQQDLKQTVNLLHQLLSSKNDEKKKQRNMNNEEMYLQERMVNAVTQSINAVMGTEVEYVIKEEINGNVLPSLKNTMDTFGQQLQSKLNQHLNVADQQLKDYIVKTVHKKSVTDTLANTLASLLPSVISDSFGEAFCNIILPKFEKSCHEMFDQVNNLFVEGTRDFVGVLQNNVRSYEEKQTSILQAKIDDFIIRLNDMLEKSSYAAMKNFAPEIVNSVKAALEEQKIYIESSMLNKAPQPMLMNSVQKQQEHIAYLIAQGKIDVAIEQVLSASDLKLLVCLCEKLDPDRIFSEPCIIQQHILLSFIQQLSVDLNIQTDLKHKFIEGAVMCLDKKHPVCEKNFPKILPAVRNRINQYITLNPNNKNTRNMKILLMALDSLLDRNEGTAVSSYSTFGQKMF